MKLKINKQMSMHKFLIETDFPLTKWKCSYIRTYILYCTRYFMCALWPTSVLIHGTATVESFSATRLVQLASMCVFVQIQTHTHAYFHIVCIAAKSFSLFHGDVG